MGENGIKITVDSCMILDLMATSQELAGEVLHLREMREREKEDLETRQKQCAKQFERLNGTIGGVKTGSKRRDEELGKKIDASAADCQKILTTAVDKWGKRIAGSVVLTGFAVVSRVELIDAWKFVSALVLP